MKTEPHQTSSHMDHPLKIDTSVAQGGYSCRPRAVDRTDSRHSLMEEECIEQVCWRGAVDNRELLQAQGV